MPRRGEGTGDGGDAGRPEMPKAYWNGVVLADSEETILLEGRHYFPPGSVRHEYLQKSQTRTTDRHKGEARYFHVTVGGRLSADAAWTYRRPKAAARHIKDYVAFWHDVEVE